MDWFLVVVGLAVLISLFILFSKWRYQYWTRRGLAQLDPKLIFGDTKTMITGEMSAGDTFVNIYKNFKVKGVKHGGIYSFLEPVYFPVDVKLVKNMLTRDFQYFGGHGLFSIESDYFSVNLFTLEGEAWKQLRSKLSPTFTSGKIKMMFNTMVEKTEGLRRVAEECVAKQEPVMVKDLLARFTTDVIGSSAFGVECNSLKDPDCEFRVIGKKCLPASLTRTFIENFFPYSVLGFLGYKAQDRDVRQFFEDLVRNTIKYREENNIKRNDFMQLLLQLKNKGTLTNDESIKGSIQGTDFLTEKEVIAQTFAFYFAGFETSSTAVTFALLELAQNQYIQEKLRKEISETLRKYNGEITYEALMEMEYLDKVVSESLRKYPPVPTLPRLCTKRWKDPDSEVIVEKGTRVMVPVWGIHMDPEFYPNPEVFNPENFSPENKAKRPEFAYLPFGEGPRMCIGLRFALLQSKIGLATLIRHFRFTLNKNTTFPLRMDEGTIVLSPKGDVLLDAKKV